MFIASVWKGRRKKGFFCIQRLCWSWHKFKCRGQQEEGRCILRHCDLYRLDAYFKLFYFVSLSTARKKCLRSGCCRWWTWRVAQAFEISIQDQLL